MSRTATLFTTAVALWTGPALFAQQAPEAPLAAALGELGPDVQRYHEHVITLASPFMDGRLPGTDGMELAKDYCQYWLEEAGVLPGFPGDAGGRTWRQPFPLGDDLTLHQAAMMAGSQQFAHGTDFQALSLGTGGGAQGPVTWVGYGIEQGPDGYTSFPPNLQLDGKIAFVFRFEPMKEDGSSQWSERGWSGAAGFGPKVSAVASRNPAAIVIVNAPGAKDPRTASLLSTMQGGRQAAEVPVLHMTHEAASKLFAGTDLTALRQHFDSGGDPVEMDTEVAVKVDLERTPLMAENVGGYLPGKGELADELIIIGAHLDHLGMGDFGSRSGPGELHPGADDNASGSAAILMLADSLKKTYDEMPEGANARSVLFVLFSGEESGLNGSYYYVNNPPYALANTKLMINFDMIGRIVNRRLQITGTGTAEGLAQLVAAEASKSELEVVTPEGRGGGSDHLPFYNKGIPYLFGAIADFHGDYHTPLDTAAKINRVDGTRTVHLFHDILLATATHGGSLAYIDPNQASSAGSSAGGLSGIKVRFGIMPGDYNDSEPGIAVGGVTPGGSAAEAGIREGDRLLRWDGQKIVGVGEWMEMMAKHNPGDVVKVGVIRDGEEITLDVKLQARSQEGR